MILHACVMINAPAGWCGWCVSCHIMSVIRRESYDTAAAAVTKKVGVVSLCTSRFRSSSGLRFRGILLLLCCRSCKAAVYIAQIICTYIAIPQHLLLAVVVALLHHALGCAYVRKTTAAVCVVCVVHTKNIIPCLLYHIIYIPQRGLITTTS